MIVLFYDVLLWLILFSCCHVILVCCRLAGFILVAVYQKQHKLSSLARTRHSADEYCELHCSWHIQNGRTPMVVSSNMDLCTVTCSFHCYLLVLLVLQVHGYRDNLNYGSMNGCGPWSFVYVSWCCNMCVPVLSLNSFSCGFKPYIFSVSAGRT